MKWNELRLTALSAVLAGAVAGVFPASLVDVAAISLDDRSLSSVRGADIQYVKLLPESCANSGATALTTITGNTAVPASGCGVANIGFTCGDCTMALNGQYGKGPIVPGGTGQGIVDLGPCGQVESGTCSVVNPNAFPLTYECAGEQIVVNPNGNVPYTCSDLLGVGPQVGGGGGGT